MDGSNDNLPLARPDPRMGLVSMSTNYSPLALRHLPQPVPNDIQPHMNPSLFTFEDAFEDLLAVSQGQKLPDITNRYEQKKLLWSMFPTGEPPHFWLHRLRSQGLLPEPRLSHFWDDEPRPDWNHFHRELDSRASSVWGNPSRQGEEKDDHHQDHSVVRDIFSVLSQVEKALFPSDEKRERSEEERWQEQQRQRRSGPDHEDDLFSAIKSSWAEGQRTWDNFVKSINDGSHAPHDRARLEEAQKETKQVVEKKEHVDRFGYLHSTTTIKTLDQDGNEIGSETHYSMRPAENDSDKPKGAEAREDEEDAFKPRKVGWFWK